MLATYPAHRFQDAFTNVDERSTHSLAPHHPHQSIPVSVWSAWSAAPAFAFDQQQHQAFADAAAAAVSRIPRQHQQPQPSGLMSGATASSVQQPPIRLHPSSPASFPVDADTPWSTSDEGVLQLGQAMLQQGPTEGPVRHKTHQRALSNSSIASTGPASPFDGVVSHPYIVSSDTPASNMAAESPCFDELHPLEPVKPLPTPSHTPLRQSYLLPKVEYPATGVRRDSRSTSLGDAPPPLTPATTTACDDLPETQSRSAPATTTTTASSTAALDAWIGHGPSEVDADRTTSTVPKLHRTMTDAIEDELFRPASLAAISTSPPLPPSTHRRTSSNNQNLLSPYRTVFNERMHAATQAHLLEARATSPATAISRERSPFRQGSPYAPSVSSFDAPSPHHARLGSLSGARHSQVTNVPAPVVGMDDDAVTRATISPKDALFEFRDGDEDSPMPLFPPVSSETSTPLPVTSAAAVDLVPSSTAAFTFSHPAPTAIHGLHLPQQYPFVSHPRREARSSFTHVSTDPIPDFPAHLTSMETSVSETNDTPSGSQEQSMMARRSDHYTDSTTTNTNDVAATSADTGTYTCTYHGCSLRFDTPADLQKHKRDGHRQNVVTTIAHDVSSPSGGMSSSVNLAAAGTAAAAGQAGPHRCDRINPSTGRPCATIFSRPYDLTRHEDTIHNARKIKARCQYCTEEKTFSRHDALTRHMRVVHPEIEFGARARKRQRLG